MKKRIEVEAVLCDVCGESAEYPTVCMGCGKEFCFSCSTSQVKRYTHAVHCGGSGDGYYCVECDLKLAESGDPLHAAYRKVEALATEYSAWHDHFRERSKAAEARVMELSRD